MKFIFENEDYVAIDKPALLLTIPGRHGDEPNLRDEVLKEIKPLWVVHRLDYDVSGVVLFARNAKAHANACKAFESRRARKTYQAWTECKQRPMLGASFHWEFLLARGKKRAYEAPHGRPAITDGRVVSLDDRVVEWELHPSTGRSHQLRVTMARAGFFIVGDKLYGARSGYDGIALRAVHLQLDDCGIDVQVGRLPRPNLMP